MGVIAYKQFGMKNSGEHAQFYCRLKTGLIVDLLRVIFVLLFIMFAIVDSKYTDLILCP